VLATFTGDWGMGHRGQGGFYRPMVRVSFALDRALHGGSAAGCHLTNGILFLAIVLGAYRAGRLLSGGGHWPLALFLAAGLVLNPVKNEALYWVSGRTDLLAALFVIWSLSCALRALDSRSLPSAVVALLLLLGGLLSQEVSLSACAILPLAALLLRPEGPLRRETWLLLLGPPALALVYLAFRAAVLGGLAGYESEPRSVAVFLESLLTGLSALFWPFQADGPANYANLLALPGILFTVAALFLTRFRRGPVTMVLAMLLALLIDITPQDGGRVLMLPLCFQVLFIAALFRRGMLSAPPAAAVAMLTALLLQNDNLRMLDQFLAAREPNATVIEEAWQALATAPDGAVLVAPEPPRQHPRRLLDPGAALIMALQTRWLEQPRSASEDLADARTPRFALRLATPDRTVTLVHALQPWMDDLVIHLLHRPGGALARMDLRRAGPAEQSGPDAAEPLLSSEFDRGEVLVWTAVAGSPTRAIPQLRSEDGNGTVNLSDGFYFSHDGKGIAWMDTVALNAETTGTAHFVPNAGNQATFRLQTLQFARYTTVNIPAE
jgi:hypothetical protein